jgi:murein DD-endopeptidase MepM/ murein hydrolase activator NlpD
MAAITIATRTHARGEPAMAAAILGSRQVQALTGGMLLAGLAAAAALSTSPGGARAPEAPRMVHAAPAPHPARPLSEQLLAPPSGATVELFATLEKDDNISALLTRTGVSKQVAAEANRLIGGALPAGIPGETEIALLLGASEKGGTRSLERIAIQPSPALKLVVGRSRQGKLRLVREAVAVDATPSRIDGRVGEGLFWSLRSAGVSAEAARDFLQLLSGRVDVARLSPDDRFELVLDQWRAADGSTKAGPLLYAGLRLGNGRNIRLVRWTVEGRSGWYDPASNVQRVDGFAKPVAGRITSPFGWRVHPILRFGRFHDGLDIGAAWGTPVIAAADGIVERAGWKGGYGRQVTIAHGDGIETGYAHLSGYAVDAGVRVRRGDVIGYVGSTGFSTGSHLHFEIRRGGHPVDPLSFRQPGHMRIDPVELAALRARAQQLQTL